jgi:glycerophosphoryl diester phosphodiesterase
MQTSRATHGVTRRDHGFGVATALAAALALAPALAHPATPAEAAARPRVIAHRGVVLEAPENTLPAIAKAIELGCAMAEIDLRYAADGEVVLMHDATLDRTTDGTGRVAEKTLAELRVLDAGGAFGAAFRGTRVPTLREAVELARGRIDLYLDLKEGDPLPVVRQVEQAGARSMVVYRPYTYLALKQILSETPRARVLVDVGDWAQAPRLIELLHREIPGGALSSDWGNWTPAVLADARRHRMATFVNVLGPSDTPENRARAVTLGFDYIQTDHPRDLLAILRERGVRTDPR